MKKLMVMLGLVAMAAGVQASTVKWSVSGITPAGTDARASGYKVYCFVSGVHQFTGADAKNYDATLVNTYTTLAAAETWVKSNGASTEGVYVLDTLTTSDEGLGGTASSLNAWGTTQSKNVMKGTTTTGAGAKYGDFFAIITDGEIGEATQYWIATKDDVKFGTTAAANTTASLALSADGWQTIGGSDTPEPTSGLLLLLGVAGLALRRRRA